MDLSRRMLTVATAFLILQFTASTTRYALVLALANFAIVAAWGSWVLSGGGTRLRRSAVNAPAFAYLALVILSYARNPRPLSDSTNIDHIWAMLSLMVYVVSANAVRTRAQLFRLRDVIFVLMNVGVALGIYAWLTSTSIPFMAESSVMFRPRRDGSGVHGCGVYGLGCLIFLLAHPEYVKPRAAQRLLLLVYMGSVLLSGSRSVLLAVPCAVLTLAMFRKRDRRTVVAVAGVAVGIGVAATFASSLPAFVSRAVDFGAAEHSVKTRMVMWWASLDLWLKNPILGVGYGRVEPTPLLKALAVFTGSGERAGELFARAPHSAYVMILRSLGSVGAALFGWMIIACLAIVRRVDNLGADKALLSLLAFLSAQLATQLVYLGAGGGENHPALYLWIGLLVSARAMVPAARAPIRSIPGESSHAYA